VLSDDAGYKTLSLALDDAEGLLERREE